MIENQRVLAILITAYAIFALALPIFILVAITIIFYDAAGIWAVLGWWGVLIFTGLCLKGAGALP